LGGILGHGIVVTSRYGNVTLDNVYIHDNAGDGVHYALNNTEWSLREQEESPLRLYKSFCETANTVEFPSYFAYRPPAAGTCCTQAFSTSYNRRLTVHFQSVIVADYRSRYRIELYNGQFDIMPLLANITFNRTLESLSSYTNELLVRLCHSCDDVRSRTCWNQSDRIQLYVVNDDGKYSIENEQNHVVFLFSLGRDADVHIWNSRIVNNSLNGVRVVNLRSLIEINQTIIAHNQRHGLDVDSGAGLFTLNFNLILRILLLLQVLYGLIMPTLITMVKMVFISYMMVENVEYFIRIYHLIINMVYLYDLILYQ